MGTLAREMQSGLTRLVKMNKVINTWSKWLAQRTGYESRFPVETMVDAVQPVDDFLFRSIMFQGSPRI